MVTGDEIALAGVVVFTVQTGLLWWYASETKKLRIDAAKQNELIREQISNASAQNKLMSDQLKVMADGLQFQRDCIEEDDQPLLDVAVTLRDAHCCRIQVISLKQNVWLTEFRSNDTQSIMQGSDKDSRAFIFTGDTARQIYLSITYKTLRGKTGTKIYQYFTGHTPDSIKIAEVPNDSYRGWPPVEKAKPFL